MSLPRDLRAAINRKAHAEGLHHAEAVKARLKAAIEAQRATGATPAQLLQLIEGFRSQNSESRI